MPRPVLYREVKAKVEEMYSGGPLNISFTQANGEVSRLPIDCKSSDKLFAIDLVTYLPCLMMIVKGNCMLQTIRTQEFINDLGLSTLHFLSWFIHCWVIIHHFNTESCPPFFPAVIFCLS